MERQSSSACTHHNQTHSVLFVGPIGSQDGDHHGNAAHDVQDDEAGSVAFELGAEEARVEWTLRLCETLVPRPLPGLPHGC